MVSVWRYLLKKWWRWTIYYRIYKEVRVNPCGKKPCFKITINAVAVNKKCDLRG
jgi:hypothetical protein